MIDPVTALAVFAGVVALLALLYWPRWGLVARLRQMSHLSERVLLEDALKHVYTCESMGHTCSMESLAGRLAISRGRAADLLSALAESKLTRTGEDGPVLTEKGRESALQLVRTHRLWERYLADRTGVPAGEWHAEAERMEHTLSSDEADDLAARLGHPAWDPHGDPIPTSGGQLPAVERPHLSSVDRGRTVEIVHLEDEPRVIYDALLEDGLDVGVRVEVVGRDDNRIHVRARGREWALSQVVAGNVTVRVLPEGSSADAPVATLLDVRTGRAGRVVGLSPACKGAQRRRLLDLGVVPGTTIEAAFSSAGGDPVAYRIRGALIALRREQARWIRIEPLDTEAGLEADEPREEEDTRDADRRRDQGDTEEVA